MHKKHFTKRKKKKQAKIIRYARIIHRKMAIFLFIFIFIISLSGLFLGWKKNSVGKILPKTHQGTSSEFNKWLDLDSLHKTAIRILHDSINENLSPELSKIDIRKNKGVAKFIFENHYWEIQLDGASGELLNIARRNSDLIENIHDGSILDKLAGTNGILKLIYTSIIGLTLLLFTLTGFWLWYGPKKIKKKKELNSN
ncbi:MAG: PepSY domain-containing protein [Bacteroidota bacterium]|nr:PepSY domain-containing protein [Bacteroidota bacterium]